MNSTCCALLHILNLRHPQQHHHPRRREGQRRTLRGRARTYARTIECFKFLQCALYYRPDSSPGVNRTVPDPFVRRRPSSCRRDCMPLDLAVQDERVSRSNCIWLNNKYLTTRGVSVQRHHLTRPASIQTSIITYSARHGQSTARSPFLYGLAMTQ